MSELGDNYFLVEDQHTGTQMAFTRDGRVFMSDDGGRSWQDTGFPDLIGVYEQEQRLKTQAKRLAIVKWLSIIAILFLAIATVVSLVILFPWGW